MKWFINGLKTIIIFILLTLFTQVGGLIYLISKGFYRSLKGFSILKNPTVTKRILFHIATYLFFTLLIVPVIARQFGRTPMPVFSHQHIGPRTVWTVLLNRHYVRPALKETVVQLADDMGKKYPNLKINYFDANHPFLKGYPLLPHLSHNDGKKLDLGFVYNDRHDGRLSKYTPSRIGYGISEEPLPNEYNRPLECGRNPKNWMYNFMRNIYPQGAQKQYTFNAVLTKELLTTFAKNKNIQKILLEPHLTSRLQLRSPKFRQVQCGSVRHDDHFHIQIH